MNPYDGLNLPQLLDLMHELAFPEPISWIPQPPGWWVLLAWLLAMTVLGAWQVIAYRRRNRYRREALKLLAAIETQTPTNPQQAAGQIAALLKRTALVAYPRHEVAGLYGADWAEFLCRSSDDDAQVVAAATSLAAAAYQPNSDGPELGNPARRWIQIHRA